MEYSTFTSEIHALILSRGQQYFRQGAVQNLTETTDGWTAEVAGNETYHVVITGAESPIEWYCDCPHDHGPVCKHVAAVFFAIRDKKGFADEEE
jgi:uncharacterized Zn finger protein